MLYDTHAHLDDEQLYAQIEEVLLRAEAAGVRYINTMGCDLASSRTAVQLAEKYPQLVWAAIGIHPQDLAKMEADCLDHLLELAQSKKVVAWGEIGLDYHYDEPPRDLQRQLFRTQLDLARSVKLPVAIHDREAHQDTLTILREAGAQEIGGVMHCFSGSWEFAKDCLNLGFFLSFAGPLTFHNAKSALEVASKAPLDCLLVETDSPYLSPVPFRGKRNEPARVCHTLARLAEIRGLSYEEMAAITTENACRLFLHS